MRRTLKGRHREGRKGETKAHVIDSGQPKSVTLGEVSKERDLEQRREECRGEHLQCAGRAVFSLLLYAAISGRNGGMSNEGGTRSSKREERQARRAGNKPALILILSGATGSSGREASR